MADRGMKSTTAGQNEDGKGKKKEDQRMERRASEAESGGGDSQEGVITISDTPPDFGPELDRAMEEAGALLSQRGRGPWNPFIGEFHPEHYDLETRTSSRHHGGPETAEQRRRSSISKVNRYLDSLPPASIPSTAESSSNPTAQMRMPPPPRPHISLGTSLGPDRSPAGGNAAHQAAPIASRVQMPSAVPRAMGESITQRTSSRAKRIEQRQDLTHESSQDEAQIFVRGGLAEVSPSPSGWVSNAGGRETPHRPVPYHLGPMQYFAPDPQFPCGYLSAPIPPTASGFNQTQQRQHWQSTRMPHATQSGRSGEAEGLSTVPSGEMQWQATGSSQPTVPDGGNGPGQPGPSGSGRTIVSGNNGPALTRAIERQREADRQRAVRDNLLEAGRRAAEAATASGGPPYEPQAWPPPLDINSIIQLGLARYHRNVLNGIAQPNQPTFPEGATYEQMNAAHRVWVVELLGPDHPYSWEEPSDEPLEQPDTNFEREFESIMRSREADAESRHR